MMSKPEERVSLANDVRIRLRRLRRIHGYRQIDVALAMKMPVNRYARREQASLQGEHKCTPPSLRADEIQTIITVVYPNLSANWLMLGQGPMFIDGQMDALQR